MSREHTSIRIIAGEFRGRWLAYPRENILRPTMTKTRESVFSSIQGSLKDVVFLDLFCAAGAMGIEAISRGASFVHFVEQDRRALKCLEENLAQLGLGERVSRIHARDVFGFLADDLNALAPAPVFVYADPPYGTEDVKKVLAHYDANTYSPLESVIVEHGVRTALGQPRSLVLLKEKRFGDTIVSYFGPRRGG